MFCPKCGNSDQVADSYCRQCGDWLPDLSSGRPRGLFRRSTREHKIKKMRVLQFISIALSLTSTVVIMMFLSSGRDEELLSLAALCGFLVAVYQIVAMVLGYKVLQPKVENHLKSEDEPNDLLASRPGALPAPDTDEIIKPGSVTERTTNLLDPILQDRVSKND